MPGKDNRSRRIPGQEEDTDASDKDVGIRARRSVKKIHVPQTLELARVGRFKPKSGLRNLSWRHKMYYGLYICTWVVLPEVDLLRITEIQHARVAEIFRAVSSGMHQKATRSCTKSRAILRLNTFAGTVRYSATTNLAFDF